MSLVVCNPLAGSRYQMNGAPGAGTHHFGQNWQSDYAYDLYVPIGTPVFAPFDALVVRVGPLGSGGRFAGIRIGLDDHNGRAAYLAHLSQEHVSEGQKVAAGQVIGHSGSAVGVAHLHYARGKTYSDGSDAQGVDPKKDLLATSTAMGSGFYHGHDARPAPTELPDGDTLRLVLNQPHREFAGWDEAKGPLVNIAKKGLKADADAAIAWRGETWHGGKDVANVCKHLARQFLGFTGP